MTRVKKNFSSEYFIPWLVMHLNDMTYLLGQYPDMIGAEQTWGKCNVWTQSHKYEK